MLRIAPEKKKKTKNDNYSPSNRRLVGAPAANIRKRSVVKSTSGVSSRPSARAPDRFPLNADILTIDVPSGSAAVAKRNENVPRLNLFVFFFFGLAAPGLGATGQPVDHFEIGSRKSTPSAPAPILKISSGRPGHHDVIARGPRREVQACDAPDDTNPASRAGGISPANSPSAIFAR